MTTAKQRQSFVEEYKNGKNIAEIAQTNDLNWASVYRILYNRDIRITEESDICTSYLSGKSTVEIGRYYGINNHLVSKILEKYGIKRTGNGQRKYQLNEHYFDKIDTPIKAYILGFFYADGSNNPSKGTVSMSLQEEDSYILERIRNEIGSEKPLEFLDYSNKHDFGYTYKNQYRLLLFSSHMCSILEKHGMVPNKSLILKFPEWLDSNLILHFIRGYFDGDGSVHFAKNGNCIITITSTNDFCLKLKEHIESSLNINTCLYDAACHNGITKVLTVNGANQVRSFLDYIYTDTDIYLERKYLSYKNKYYNFSQSA